MLKGKKILFLSVKFFNYETIIKKKLEDLGGEVDYFDERPSNSLFAKAIIRLKKDVYQQKINQYYRSILSEISGKKYDYFLVLKGEAVPIFFIEEIKRLNPNIKAIYYNWDSFKNNPNAQSIIHLFENRFTFDKEDAKTYDMSFRPLFFSDDYSTIKNIQATKEYDVMFIGTAHSDRYVVSEEVRSWVENHKLKMFAFYFSPSKWVFKYKQFFDKTFKKFDINKISFSSLSHSEILELYKKSKIILDINHPLQKGLTMRTFEALGAGKKLITTNTHIKEYPFYNPNNIWVIDRDNIKLEEDFFKTEFTEISQNVYHKMSIEGWIECLFIEEQTNFWNND